MPLRDDDNALEPIDDLLAMDRKSIAGAANQRIAGGMYARIARARAERSSVTARNWQWQLAIVSLACAVLVAAWFTLPKRNVPREVPQSAHLPAVAPDNAPMAELPPARRAPGRSPARSVPSFHPMAARAELPRQATFPINVAPTEQERLLLRLASQHPKQLLAMAEAMAATRDQEEAERQEFDQWLKHRGGSQ